MNTEQAKQQTERVTESNREQHQSTGEGLQGVGGDRARGGSEEQKNGGKQAKKYRETHKIEHRGAEHRGAHTALQ